MKHIITYIFIFISSILYAQTSDLIISEYGEGFGTGNRYIELYNGTGADVDLSNYEIWKVMDGGTWPEQTIALSGPLINGSLYIVANGAANAIIIASTDLSTGFVDWNGNDAVGLAKDDGTGTFILIDAIGTEVAAPGVVWDVAGTLNATSNHTLVRKASVCDPNTNWATSAGTTTADSEWIVMPNEDWSNLGIHNNTCCFSSTTWTAGAWTAGAPDIDTSVIIDDNYNTGIGSFSACSLTVNAGFRLTVDNGDFVEIENDVVVNGELFVETQGSFVQNDDAGTFTNNGASLVNKTTASKLAWFYYTYWSSPVANETINGVFPDAPVDRRFLFNANNYLDTDSDDIDDNGDDWQLVNGIDNIMVGVGYAVTSSSFGPPFPRTDVAIFQGAFNTGDISTGIIYNAINLNSWNFIGNPYPSAIDFAAFQAANSTVIDGTVSFWSQASPPDAANPGNESSNFSQNDYATYTVGTGGAAGSSGVIPTQYVPSGQGFFVVGLDNANATFTNSMRVTGNNDQFFRSANSKTNSIANKLWINLTSDNGVFNQILVGYVNGATNSDNGLMYDAPRNLSSGAPSILYTNIEGSNKKFVIQGKAENSINEDEVINVGFKTTIDVPTIYTLSIAQLEGDFLNDNPIYLKDNLLNTLHNLKDSDYNFTSEIGEFNERFEIVFNQEALSLGDQTIPPNDLSIIELQNGNVQFKLSGNLAMASIQIIDLQGRILYDLKATGNNKTYNLSNLSQAPYIAKVTLANGSTITKKAIKRF